MEITPFRLLIPLSMEPGSLLHLPYNKGVHLFLKPTLKPALFPSSTFSLIPIVSSYPQVKLIDMSLRYCDKGMSYGNMNRGKRNRKTYYFIHTKMTIYSLPKEHKGINKILILPKDSVNGWLLEYPTYTSM